MTWNSDYKPLLKLIVPLVLAGMVGGLVYFFISLFLSKLGSEVLAAGALGSWLYGIFVVIIFGILGSVNIVISHLYGKHDLVGMIQVARDGLILSLILFIPTFILFWNMDVIFIYLGQSQTVVDLAKPFLHALSFALLPYFIFTTLLECLIGLGHTRIVIRFTLVTVILSIILAYLLIFGSSYTPQLGISGAGWAITLSYCITLLGLMVFLFFNKTYRNYFVKVFNLRPCEHLFELMEIGFPLGLMYCVEVGFFFVITLIIGRAGHELLAANQVAMQFLWPLIGACFSISQGISVRIGHLLGSKNYEKAKNVLYIGIKCSVLFILGFSCLNWLCPRYLIAFDFSLNNPRHTSIIYYATHFLYLSGVFQILEAIRVALFGVLRAMKQTKFCLMSSVVTYWILGLPLGLFLEYTYFDHGVGVWLGVIVATLVSIIWLWAYLQKLIPCNDYS